MTRLENAGTSNSNIEIRRNNRVNLSNEIKTKREQAEKLKLEAERLEVKLTAAGLLPDLIDVSELSAQIKTAQEQNKQIENLTEKLDYQTRADKLEKQSKAISEDMDKRAADKNKAIAEAVIPVKGIGFGDSFVTLDGVPFDQASDAQQLIAGCMIAMANNPELKVIRIREGSLLDDQSEEAVRMIAEANDFQIWQEKVDNSGQIGFVIEEGELKEKKQESEVTI